MAENIRNTKSGRYSKKGSETDKVGTVKETVSRRHKFTIIFDLLREAFAEEDVNKKDRMVEQVKAKLLKLKPEEKAQMIEIAGALYHEASESTDMTNRK